ncbi:MAG: 1-acyl-sn-glycerol-3-phosphate acyltransferase [Chloroflexota bacterium]|nr:MAG: 1-acyl-sn-glycerol-3-phosphate acyltransferase [Chloroflexota bacterium]
MAYSSARDLVRLFLRLVARFELQGKENVPASGAFIVASNHIGRLDAALVYVVLDRSDVTMMVAEKYRKNPLFRFLVKHLNAIWVDRFNADFSAMRASLSRLRDGGVLVMAPEGTRSKSGTLICGRPGVSYLAARSGVPVLPVAIMGSEDSIVSKQLKRFRRPHIIARAGPTFVLPPLKGKEKEEALEGYTDEIMCRIAALLPPAYHGVYAGHPRLKELLDEGEKVQPG